METQSMETKEHGNKEHGRAWRAMWSDIQKLHPLSP